MTSDNQESAAKVRETVRAAILRLGIAETARLLRMGVEPVLRIGGGFDVREASLHLAATRVHRLDHATSEPPQAA